MSRRTLIPILVIPCLVACWYWFRPERLFVNAVASDEFTERDAGTLATGIFHSVAHETSGTATIYRLDSGQRVLRLSKFQTSNGPDVRVILVAADDTNSSLAVAKAGFVELGSLRGNIGDQNYDVPSKLDLGKYRSVTIWCQRFSVNFGTAPLTTAELNGAAGKRQLSPIDAVGTLPVRLRREL